MFAPDVFSLASLVLVLLKPALPFATATFEVCSAAIIVAVSTAAIGRLGSHAESILVGMAETTVAPDSSAPIMPGSGTAAPDCVEARGALPAPAACWAIGICTVTGLRRVGGAGGGAAGPRPSVMVGRRVGTPGVAWGMAT